MSAVPAAAKPNVTTPAAQPAPARGLSGWLKRPAVVISLMFVASRGVVLAGYLAGKHGSLYEAIGAAGGSYDASWFERVVRWGYGGASAHYPVASFYPGYPLLVDVVFWPVIGALKLVFPQASVDAIAHQDVLAGSMVLVANLALITAVIILWKLYRPRLGTIATYVGIGLLLVSPVSFFLSSGFSESLFIACVAASFLFIERRQWAAVGAAAGLACLVRFPGVFLALPLIIAWLQANPRPPRRQTLLGGVLFVVGAAAFPAFLWVAFHDPLFYFHLQVAGPWHHQLLNPLASIVDALAQGWQAALAVQGTGTTIRAVDGPAILMVGLAVLFLLITVIAGWRSRLRAWELVWVGLVLLFPLMVGYASISRYALTAFPAFFLIGSWLRRSWPITLLIGTASSVYLFILTQTMSRGFFVA